LVWNGFFINTSKAFLLLTTLFLSFDDVSPPGSLEVAAIETESCGGLAELILGAATGLGSRLLIMGAGFTVFGVDSDDTN
jgi:hypothetical protein